MSTSPSPVLDCSSLDVAVPGRMLVEALQLSLRPGDFLAVLGRNGAGKTLTLHTLAGLRKPAAGGIRLDGRPLDAHSRRQIAARLALLPQEVDDVFPATVLETALIGRHPHIDAFAWESASDRGIARDALAGVDMAGLADREVDTLSGGERRRVAIAQVLAQSPDIFLLDEPTNHLDPQHQLQVLGMFAEQAERGKIVVATLHDVNLAARFATECLLLHGDGRWQVGPRRELLTETNLGQLYRTSMEAVTWRGRHLFVAAGERPPAK